MESWMVDLNDRSATELEIVGGKGANLALLSQRGFRVPQAFIITTKVFDFVMKDESTGNIYSVIDRFDQDSIEELEKLSERIKTIICQRTLPETLIQLIFDHYHQLCRQSNETNLHVAVRSSATAEDLPDNSFAGQQDTYLHVTEENLIENIQHCWASLFTARAISYRKKFHIDHNLLKLAVVIQRMIPSEVSGVAFTANPISGARNEVIIDATCGLGEALVSGLITPDHYEIDFHHDDRIQIRMKTIGKKHLKIIGKSSGGTETLMANDTDEEVEALPDASILQLAHLAKRVERSYEHRPQDLEWAFYQGQFYLLQARPITTLFPIPRSPSYQSDLRCFLSLGTIQGFLEPITPLGQSTLRTVLTSFTRIVGCNSMTTTDDDISSDPTRHNIFKASASRVWIDITGILTSPLAPMFGVSMIDTGMNKIVQYLKQSKVFTPTSRLSFLTTFISILGFVIPTIFRTVRNFLFPRYGKNLFRHQLDLLHRSTDEGFQRATTFSATVEHFHRTLVAIPKTVIPYGLPCVLPGVISLRMLQKLAHDPTEALALTRAVESNPTTEMNLTLWKITELVREFSSATKSVDLLRLYQSKSFNPVLQEALDDFIRQYGCRGIGEIDFGRPRWSDEPERIFDQIENYLKITRPEKSIARIHHQSQQSAYDTLSTIEKQLRYPFIQRPWLHFLFKRLRILFSVRESPKFHGLIETFGKCRQALRRRAQSAVEEGLLSYADEIFFLYIDELKRLAAETDRSDSSRATFWKNLIDQRRAEHFKHSQLKRVPLLFLSDGRTFYDATTIPDGNNQSIVLKEGEYLGSPVSPGVYEGKVRIVDDPIHSQLESGEILVCTATDPAWTSLFPIVGALVLEMGGMLQHGAIVSREYGLPAVVGVANAKKIFHNGQRIQVNGSTGRIQVLPDKEL